MGNKKYKVRFQVITVTSMKMAVFGGVAPCSLIALMTEAVNASETSVSIY
jgi:hypothetical protein